MSTTHRVDIGFLEKTDIQLLKSNYFPSKVGGRPAWLDLKQLPSAEDLQCKTCNAPMIFLCQLYAPFDEKESCFHRTLFIFICRNGACCTPNTNNNVLVWRNQLPRSNNVYPDEPPVENVNNTFNIREYVKICDVCGVFASKHCSKCKIASYCSRAHQLSDWKPNHKAICGTEQQIAQKQSSLLFEEWELIIEAETIKHDIAREVDEKRRMEDYEKLVVDGNIGTLCDEPETDLQDFSCVDADKVFLKFRKHMADNPDQVIRYERNGTPLWVADHPIPTSIPHCEQCGASRQFEFQILPQLLHCLHEYCLDWGTLAIYTCKDNCDKGPLYKKEYIFKQDVSDRLENK